jgi:hypothetical protein
MFASLASHGGFFRRRSNASRAEEDLQALLARMRQRLYPETIPALASFWLKTVCAGGYSLQQWRELSHLLELALDEPPLDDCSREVVIEIRNWIQQRVVLTGRTPESIPQCLDPVRGRLNRQQLTAYIVRLLNEWLPVEISRLLIDESDATDDQESGIPVLTIASAIERLVVREHLSRETLERLVEPKLLSPECVYPAHLEVLRDVALLLLGRTCAPTPPVMPAILLCIAPNSNLHADYREALPHSFVVRRPRGEEVHVPIAPARALEMNENERVWIGSIIVTMDGRCWESENLRCAEQPSVVYRPVGPLRIDYSQEHTSLRVPWPETGSRWSGGDCFRRTFKVFGREWHVYKWEVDTERTWLHLELSRVMPISEVVPAADARCWRLPPASVDMAWTALERALISSLVQKNSGPIEQLRQSNLIPIGRAIVGLTESVMSRRPPTHKVLETHLRTLRYLVGPILSEYGRVPWKILPRRVRASLLRSDTIPRFRDC